MLPSMITGYVRPIVLAAVANTTPAADPSPARSASSPSFSIVEVEAMDRHVEPPPSEARGFRTWRIDGSILPRELFEPTGRH